METRRSALHDLLQQHNPRWSAMNGMLAPVSMDDRRPTIALADASCMHRMGVKGSQAEVWLHSQGIEMLPGINAWVRTPEGTLVARLGRTEFFLEDSPSATTTTRLRSTLRAASGLTPVIRQDCAIVLSGERTNELLTQTCSVNFAAYSDADRFAILTSMVGVSVLVIWELHTGQRGYRIWCDPSFAAFLWETLLGIAQELGGGAVGLGALIPEVVR